MRREILALASVIFRSVIIGAESDCRDYFHDSGVVVKIVVFSEITSVCEGCRGMCPSS